MRFVLHDTGCDYDLRWRRDSAPAEGEVLARAEAAAVVRRLAAAPDHARTLRWMLGAARGVVVARLDDRALRDVVAGLVARGDVAVARRARRHVLPGAEGDEVEAEAAPFERATVRTWIEVVLVDEDCRPAPGVRYRVVHPDGAVSEGTLDHRGRARVDDIEQAGDCKITFPDLDTDAWRGGCDCPELAPEPELTFVAFQLVDMDGEPVAGERYRVTLADGSVHEGTLDGAGRVRYDDILPGRCAITFPDLDTEAWEAIDDGATTPGAAG